MWYYKSSTPPALPALADVEELAAVTVVLGGLALGVSRAVTVQP